MIGITGATGLVGARVLETLARDGVQTTAFSRNPASLEGRLPRGASARAWPPRPDDVALDGVVHLLGEPVSGRWTAAKKRAIRSSRLDGTRLLVDAIAALPPERRPRTLVSASAMGFYGDRGDEVLSETARAGSDFLAEVCVGWEQEAMRAQELGVRVVTLRIGLVMSREGGALERMLPLFRMGLGGTMGPGTQWWSWIHLDDPGGLARLALDREDVRGPLTATAPQPVAQREFAATLARVLHRPAFLPAPTLALRAALGEFAAELVSSRRVVPSAALAAGYAFQFPDLEACLVDVARR